MLVVPNANHGMGGAYGERRMREFFVRHLLERARTVAAASAVADVAAERLARPGRPGRRRQRAPRRDRALRGRPRQPVAVGPRARLAGARRADARVHARDGSTGSARLDFDRLSHDGQVDYLLFHNHLGHELRQLEIRDHERAEWEPLVPFARPILDLDAARRELKPMDWAKVADERESVWRSRSMSRARRSSASRRPGVAVQAQPDATAPRGCGPPTGRWPRSRACGTRSAPGSPSTTATIPSSPGGCRSPTRRPTRRSRPMRTPSASAFGASAAGAGGRRRHSAADAGAAGAVRAPPGRPAGRRRRRTPPRRDDEIVGTPDRPRCPARRARARDDRRTRPKS